MSALNGAADDNVELDEFGRVIPKAASRDNSRSPHYQRDDSPDHDTDTHYRRKPAERDNEPTTHHSPRSGPRSSERRRHEGSMPPRQQHAPRGGGRGGRDDHPDRHRDRDRDRPPHRDYPPAPRERDAYYDRSPLHHPAAAPVVVRPPIDLTAPSTPPFHMHPHDRHGPPSAMYNQQHPPYPPHIPPAAPSKFDGPLLSFKEFMLLPETDNIEPNEAAAAYEDYKRSYKETRLQRFFDMYGDCEFFAERFDVVTRGKLWQKQQQQYTAAAATLESDIKAGLQPQLHLNTPDEPRTDSRPNIVNATIYINAVKADITRNALAAPFNTIAGLRHIFLSDPLARQHVQRELLRHCYVTYDTNENALAALQAVDAQRVDKFQLRLRPHTRPATFAEPAPAVTLQPERITKDLVRTKALARQLDRERGLTHNFLLDAPSDTSMSNDTDEKSVSDSTAPMLDTLGDELHQLNAVLLYLRWVHHACYYCHQVFYDYEQLFNSCGQYHVRDSSLTDEEVNDRYVQELDAAIAERIEQGQPEGARVEVEMLKQALRDDEQADKTEFNRLVQDVYAKQCTQVDEGKFRCNLCQKMFKGDTFVHKHITNKHSDEIAAVDRQTRKRQTYQFFVDEVNRLNLIESLPLPQQARPMHESRQPMSAPSDRLSGRGRRRSRSPDGGEGGGRGYLEDALSPAGRRQIHIPRRSLANQSREHSSDTRTPQQPAAAFSQPPSAGGSAPRGGRQMRSYADVDAVQTDSFTPDYAVTGGFNLFAPVAKRKRVSLTKSVPAPNHNEKAGDQKEPAEQKTEQNGDAASHADVSVAE